MSIRAHRVNKMVIGKESFNLSFDEGISDYLEKCGYTTSLDFDSTGMIELSIEALEEITQLPNIDQNTREDIKNDVSWAKSKNKNYIFYYCY
ncbi:MAG TPA: hypothetical protein PLG34_10640 [Spirochaetota bacterium]|nr:hypothetical protein [Spirochaetota bacterium]